MTYEFMKIYTGPVRPLFFQMCGHYFIGQNYGHILFFTHFLFIITSFLFSASASATTIVLIRTQNEIVVGADSKATNEYYEAKQNLFCKIHRAGDLMFVVSGIAEDDATGFNVTRIVTEAARKGGTVNDIAARIDTALVKPLSEALLHFKKISPDGYIKQIRNHKGVTLQLALFRFENGVPIVYEKSFGEPNADSGKIPAVGKVVRCPGENCQGSRIILALGSNSAINDYLKRNTIPPQADSCELIEELINLQIKASPAEVGKPIDLVRYDETGIHWIKRKQECEN